MHKDKIPPNTKISSNKRKVGDRYEQKSPSYNHEYKKFKNQENKNAICKIFNKIEIASDGNCLFRAILYCLFQNDNLHKELRADVCNYMLENRKDFESYLLYMEITDMDFVAYVERMKKEGIWGGLTEVHAAALLLHFNYCFYYSYSAIPCIKQTLFPNEVTIHIEYMNGNHFNSLIPKDGKIKIDLKKELDPIAKCLMEYDKRIKLRSKPIKTEFEDVVREVEFQSSQEGRSLLKLCNEIQEAEEEKSLNTLNSKHNKSKSLEKPGKNNLKIEETSTKKKKVIKKTKNNEKLKIENNENENLNSKNVIEITNNKLNDEEQGKIDKAKNSGTEKFIKKSNLYPLAKKDKDTYNQVYQYFSEGIKPDANWTRNQFKNWKKEIKKTYYLEKNATSKVSKSKLKIKRTIDSETIDFTIPLQFRDSKTYLECTCSLFFNWSKT